MNSPSQGTMICRLILFNRSQKNHDYSYDER